MILPGKVPGIVRETVSNQTGTIMQGTFQGKVSFN